MVVGMVGLYELEMYDQIYDEEHNYDDDYEEEFNNNTYYLGICAYDKDIDEWLLASTVKNKTLFNYPYNSIVDYLNNYSVIEENKNAPTEIMYLSFQGDEPFHLFTVIKKTFWLKLIQRKWKKIFQIRRQTLQNRMQLSSIYHREIFGVWPVHIRTMPGLHGLLAY